MKPEVYTIRSLHDPKSTRSSKFALQTIGHFQRSECSQAPLVGRIIVHRSSWPKSLAQRAN
jgi:hypothetical protein